MSLIQIVITGGPRSGKTTCFSVLEQRLTEKGYKVITVSGTSTEMTLAGIQLSEIGLLSYEKLLIELQLTKEKIATEAANLYPKTVILLDRGLPDCLAYMPKEDYEKELACYHMHPNEVLNRYDAVFHLVTAAKGAEEFYADGTTASPDPDLDIARRTDGKTQQAYVGHPHLRVIDSSTDFHTKVNRLCHEVFTVLGIPVPLEIQRKFLIERPSETSLLQHGAISQRITQAYLKSKDGNERRIRQRGNQDGFTCFYTEKRTFSALKRIERERKISEKEYLALLTESKYILTKTRWSFLEKAQYFELDTFDQVPDLALLEIELTQENQHITLPDWIKPIKEVSDCDAYHNYTIAKKGFPREIKPIPKQAELYK